jgi:hypothetical protein
MGDIKVFTKDGKERCRFDMFVRLYPEVPSHFPKNSKVWTHRGDKYTKNEPEMLCKLVRHIIRKRNLYSVIELYDNGYPEDDERRLIFKMNNQIVEGGHRLYHYADILKKVPLPDYMK